MNIGGLLPMQDLAQALKVNVDALPQSEKLTGVDGAAMQAAMEGLMSKSLGDLNFPKDSLERLQDPAPVGGVQSQPVGFPAHRQRVRFHHAAQPGWKAGLDDRGSRYSRDPRPTSIGGFP